MPYALFDDQYPHHRKIRQLSDAQFRVHSQGILWCAEYTTDGKILRSEIADVADPISNWSAVVKVLVRDGLWEPVPDGWLIHDYLDWNKSAAWWAGRREAGRTRAKRFREARNGVTDPGSNGVTRTQGPGEDRERTGRGPGEELGKNDLATPLPAETLRRNGVSNATPDQTRPTPLRGGRAGARVRTREDPTVPIPEPPPTCPKHIDDPDPPPCAACKAARLTHERWVLAEVERKRRLPKCPKPGHQGEYAHNCRWCRGEELARAEVDESPPSDLPSRSAGSSRPASASPARGSTGAAPVPQPETRAVPVKRNRKATKGGASSTMDSSS